MLALSCNDVTHLEQMKALKRWSYIGICSNKGDSTVYSCVFVLRMQV